MIPLFRALCARVGLVAAVGLEMTGAAACSHRPTGAPGNRSVVASAQDDTARPPVPTELGAPPQVLTLPHEGEIVFRNVVDVRFDDSTSGHTIRAFLARYGATIVGGTKISRAYILEIPDPGSTWEAYDSVIRAMRSAPGVSWVSVVAIRKTHINSRVPLTAPDTVPAWVYAPENLSSDTGASYEYYADVIIVAFNPDATQADRHAAIDAVNGTVVGGHPMPPGEGFYYVRLEAGRRLEPLVRAVMKLWSMRQVGAASLVTPLEEQRPPPVHSSELCGTRPCTGRMVAISDLIADTAPPSAQQREWPLLTDRLPALDTTRVVALPGDTFRIFRTDITLRFSPDVSDSAKAAFFSRHSMMVLGVTRSGRFFVRMPDPGTSVEALFQVLEQLRGEPEAAGAMWIPRSAMPDRRDSRLPSDWPGGAWEWHDRARASGIPLGSVSAGSLRGW